MTRYRATSPQKEHRSIIYNPGGPGGPGSLSGIAQTLGLPMYTNATVEHYDVIGLDPRGVGLSTPVRCDPDIYNKRVSLFPNSETQYHELVNANKAFGESCQNKTGQLFYHLDTTSAAHDLESVRVALGEKHLNWIGLSYGSMLGAAYAELYPEHVGRMVLDGNVDHSLSETSALQGEISTYEDTLNQFFHWCNNTATLDECPLKGQNLPELFDNLTTQADTIPVPAPGCEGNSSICWPTVTGEDIRNNIQGNGYLNFVNAVPAIPNSGWTILAHVLDEAILGNTTALSTTLAVSETDLAFPGLAIGCLDWNHESTSLADLMYKQQLAKTLAPHTKGASQSYRYQAQCIGWPAPLKTGAHPLNQTQMAKVPPMLLVNSYMTRK